MAYMTVSLSAGSYDPATNSTPVSATVSISWTTSESYDQTNGTGTLTIGDYSTNFSTNFNASRTESGSQILGSGSTTIYHDSNGSPVEVTAWADGAGYSASNFITLSGGTPSGDSGGSGNTGGSGGSGNTSGGDGDDDSVTYKNCTITIIQGENTTIKVFKEDGTEVKNGDVIQNQSDQPIPHVYVYFYVDDGYYLYEHTVDGKPFSSGEKDGVSGDMIIQSAAVKYYYLSIKESPASTVSVYRNSSVSFDFSNQTISDGAMLLDGDTITVSYNIPEDHSLLRATINGESIESGNVATVSSEVSVVVTAMKTGIIVKDIEQCYCYETVGGTGSFSGYTSTNTAQFGVGNDGLIYSTSIIKFVTPNFYDQPDSIILSLDIESVTGTDANYYALCSSDENKDLYTCTTEVTSDQNMVLSGTTTESKISISASSLLPNTTYYMFLYGGRTVALNPASNHRVYVNFTKDIVFIDNGSEFVAYSCYIDNGDKWGRYTPYITTIYTEKWDGLFVATVNAEEGLNLRESYNTTSSVLTVVPYESKLSISELSIGEDGTTIWGKTTYSPYTGWCSTNYLNFEVLCRINNENGAPFFLTPSEADYVVWPDDPFYYNQEITISSFDLTDPCLIGSENQIWGYLSKLSSDGESTIWGYVRMKDVEILTEKSCLDWELLGLSETN